MTTPEDDIAACCTRCSGLIVRGEVYAWEDLDGRSYCENCAEEVAREDPDLAARLLWSYDPY